jgi:hypothetical protein
VKKSPASGGTSENGEREEDGRGDSMERVGAFPGFGIIAFSTVVPLAPAAVGVTVHAQAIRTGGFPACDNHVSMPITP